MAPAGHRGSRRGRLGGQPGHLWGRGGMMRDRNVAVAISTRRATAKPARQAACLFRNILENISANPARV